MFDGMKFGLLQVLMVLFSVCGAEDAPAVSAGDVMPQVEIVGVDKPSVKTADMQGQVVVINFWATWCDSCKEEIAEMAREFKSLHKNRDFGLVLLSVDKDREKARNWLRDHAGEIGADLTRFLYSDADFSVAESLSVDSFPFTVVLDREGKVIYVQRGYGNGKKAVSGIRDAAAAALKS